MTEQFLLVGKQRACRRERSYDLSAIKEEGQNEESHLQRILDAGWYEKSNWLSHRWIAQQPRLPCYRAGEMHGDTMNRRQPLAEIAEDETPKGDS
jgi:hypothetical protein